MTDVTVTPPRADFELPELKAAWSAGIDAITSLAEPLSTEQWLAPTPCPGWTVADVVAHCVDIETFIGGLPRPEHEPDWERLPHVKSAVGRFIETGIDHRRARSKDEILAELAQVVELRRAQVDALSPGQEVPGLTSGPVPVERQLAIRAFDLWVHEQDIRAAIAADGDWATLPARVSWRQMTRALPFIWGKGVGAPPGALLRVDVTGPDFADAFVVTVDPDGRAGFGDSDVPADAVDVHLVTDWPDLMRLMCGRIDVEDPSLRARIGLFGDADLGEKLLRELPVTP